MTLFVKKFYMNGIKINYGVSIFLIYSHVNSWHENRLYFGIVINYEFKEHLFFAIANVWFNGFIAESVDT